jgi:uncharacterized protein (DUF2236 family)
MRVYQRFIRPLSLAEQREFYAQSKVQAELLGCPLSHQPDTFNDFREYLREMVGSLAVSERARALARDVLHPKVPWVAEPVFGVARQLTVGLLPRPLREQYGLHWDRPRKLALLTACAASRQVVPRMPGTLRRAPSLVLA